MSLVARMPEAEALLGSNGPISRWSAIIHAPLRGQIALTTAGRVHAANKALGGIRALGDVRHAMRKWDEVSPMQEVWSSLKAPEPQMVGIYIRQ